MIDAKILEGGIVGDEANGIKNFGKSAGNLASLVHYTLREENWLKFFSPSQYSCKKI